MKTITPAILIFLFGIHSVSFNTTYPLELGRGQMPALNTDQHGNIHLVYGIGDSLLYAYSSNKGESFNKPQLIEKINGLNASATRGPQVVSTNKGLSVVASTESGSIYSWVQNEKNKWIRAGKVTDMDSVALEGFVSLASDGKSKLFAVWLDVRNNKHNKIFGARSTDGGRTWSRNINVYTSPDTTVCECCKPSVAMNGDNVYVMFRNWLNGNRDLYVISSSDAGKSFGKAEKLGNGSWPLKGCPMDGGNITVNKTGLVQTVWRRHDKIYSCQPGRPEKVIGEGRSCTMESINGRNAYAWLTKGEVICTLPDGSSKNFGKGMSPVIKAIDDNNLVCTWERDQQIYTSVIKL